MVKFYSNILMEAPDETGIALPSQLVRSKTVDFRIQHHFLPWVEAVGKPKFPNGTDMVISPLGTSNTSIRLEMGDCLFDQKRITSGSRVLLLMEDQPEEAELNGIWLCTNTGAPGVRATFNRANDCPWMATEEPGRGPTYGTLVHVREGAKHAKTTWMCTAVPSADGTSGSYEFEPYNPTASKTKASVSMFNGDGSTSTISVPVAETGWTHCDVQLYVCDGDEKHYEKCYADDYADVNNQAVTIGFASAPAASDLFKVMLTYYFG